MKGKVERTRSKTRIWSQLHVDLLTCGKLVLRKDSTDYRLHQQVALQTSRLHTSVPLSAHRVWPLHGTSKGFQEQIGRRKDSRPTNTQESLRAEAGRTSVEPPPQKITSTSRFQTIRRGWVCLVQGRYNLLLLSGRWHLHGTGLQGHRQGNQGYRKGRVRHRRQGQHQRLTGRQRQGEWQWQDQADPASNHRQHHQRNPASKEHCTSSDSRFFHEDSAPRRRLPSFWQALQLSCYRGKAQLTWEEHSAWHRLCNTSVCPLLSGSAGV